MEINNDNIIISNIENYNITFYNGNLILSKKLKEISLEQIKALDFKKSTIINCSINNENKSFKKYKQIINYLFEEINDIDIILDNTILNIEKGKYEDRGYKFNSKLNISIQGVDSNKSIQEIFNISKISQISINIKIKLENKQIVNIT